MVYLTSFTVCSGDTKKNAQSFFCVPPDPYSEKKFPVNQLIKRFWPYSCLLTHSMEVYDGFEHNKTCVKRPFSKRPQIGFKDQFSLNTGQKYCRMLQREHSAILWTFIKLPFVIKIFVFVYFCVAILHRIYCIYETAHVILVLINLMNSQKLRQAFIYKQPHQSLHSCLLTQSKVKALSTVKSV